MISENLPHTKPDREIGEPVKWYRPKLDREVLKELNQRSDFKGFVQTLGFLGTLTVTGSALVWACFHQPWLAFPLLLIHGGCCAFLINGFHELVHDSVFKTRWLNRFFLHILSFLGWYNHIHFWASHQEHHKFTLHPPDDLEPQPSSMTLKGLLKFGIVDPNGIRYAFVGTYRTAMGKLGDPWETYLFTEVKPEWRTALHRWARIVLIGHLAIAISAIATGWWPLILAITIPRWFGVTIHFLANGSQHIGLPKSYPDFRVCCRTVTLNPFLQFLYWNMNFHTEHHMFAAVPCYNLPRLHRLIKHELPPTPHGLLQTWKEIGDILRKRAFDPNYEHWPDVPTKV